MNEVTLANGSTEDKAVVEAVMLSITALWNKEEFNGFLAVYELHQICKDPNYSAFNIEMLKKLRLVQQNGCVHSSVRNVVLSACKGKLIKNAYIGSPYAD